MTLPPNITPKFFQRSPRDALRRVTSLLIRGKGKLFLLFLTFQELWPMFNCADENENRKNLFNFRQTK